MRELLTSLLLTSCMLPIAAGGMQLSSDFAESGVPGSLVDLNDEPLWSSGVRRVDPSQQAYERLPANDVTNNMVGEGNLTARVKITVGGFPDRAHASNGPNAKPDILADLQAAKTREWCSTRYRSYDPDDNSYQPYGGGPRRICAIPFELPMAPGRQVADIGSANEPDANARWCRERYSSYRVEDNSYQPFSGGRKPCPGPRSQSASNSDRTVVGSSVIQF